MGVTWAAELTPLLVGVDLAMFEVLGRYAGRFFEVQTSRNGSKRRQTKVGLSRASTASPQRTWDCHVSIKSGRRLAVSFVRGGVNRAVNPQ
jgi:hypothetical protein